VDEIDLLMERAMVMTLHQRRQLIIVAQPSARRQRQRAQPPDAFTAALSLCFNIIVHPVP